MAEASPRLQALDAAIGKALRKRWPKARREHVFPGTSYEMDAWLVPIPDPVPQEEWKGTMPHDVFTVGPTEKKAGITVHVWHPKHPELLQENAAWLKEAGFKPMVGCLQWNRKADFPMDAFEQLLDKA